MEKNRNFEFVEISKTEFNSFIKDHEQSSFMQTVELGNLKDEMGDISYYFGVKEKNKLVCASLILEEPSVMGRKSFYAPRGFLIDYSDIELLNFFTRNLEEFCKSKKGFRIIIDPNVIYQIRTSEGDIIPENKKNDYVINNLENIGYKHFGFNLYDLALQMRWEYRLKLDKSYEEIKLMYSKKVQ